MTRARIQETRRKETNHLPIHTDAQPKKTKYAVTSGKGKNCQQHEKMRSERRDYYEYSVNTCMGHVNEISPNRQWLVIELRPAQGSHTFIRMRITLVSRYHGQSGGESTYSRGAHKTLSDTDGLQ